MVPFCACVLGAMLICMAAILYHPCPRRGKPVSVKALAEEMRSGDWCYVTTFERSPVQIYNHRLAVTVFLDVQQARYRQDGYGWTNLNPELQALAISLRTRMTLEP